MAALQALHEGVGLLNTKHFRLIAKLLSHVEDVENREVLISYAVVKLRAENGLFDEAKFRQACCAPMLASIRESATRR